MSPELVINIERETSSEKIPEGSKNNELKSTVDRVPDIISRIAEGYRKTHPEWFKDFRATNGHVVEYFSPELVSMIKAETLAVKEAPEGWKTINSVVISTQRSAKSLNIMAEAYEVSSRMV